MLNFIHFHPIQSTMKIPFQILIKITIPLLLILLNSCSDTSSAKGTGSEGESFIYGTLLDSTENTTLQEGIVILGKIVLSDTGDSVQWMDTVISDMEGRFQIKPPQAGSYFMQFRWKDSLFLQLHDVEWNDSNLDLGKLGLARIKSVPANVIHYPCSNPVFWLVGSSSQSIADSLGSFTLESVMPGRSTLYAQCDQEILIWNLTLSGQCMSPSLADLDWSLPNQQIIINSECKVIRR